MTHRNTLYGFKSCDMVRAAIKWLDANGVAYTFFDYRREPLSAETVDGWFARAGWETVFNRNSTAFKELTASEQAAITPAKAKALILANTNFIKRPVLDLGNRVLVGFKAPVWASELRGVI